MSFTEGIVQLRITSATVIDGVIVRVGQLVEMVESEAKQLLRLGKAEIHAVAGNGADADQAAAAQAAAAAAQAATQPPPTVIPKTPSKAK